MLQVSMKNMLQVFGFEYLIFRYNLVQLVLVGLFVLPGLYLKDPIVMIWGLTIAKTFAGVLVLIKVLSLCGINYKLMLFRLASIFGGLLIVLHVLTKGWALI